MPVKISFAILDNLQQSKNPIVVAISSRRASFSQNIKDNYIGRYGYRSSKTAMNSAMQVLSQDFMNHSIPVIMLHPGRVATQMTKYDGMSIDESVKLIAQVISISSTETTGQFIDVTNGKILKW